MFADLRRMFAVGPYNYTVVRRNFAYITWNFMTAGLSRAQNDLPPILILDHDRIIRTEQKPILRKIPKKAGLL